MNQSAKLEKRKKLELSLRRDRGYIYFPDAIQRCIEASVSDSWSWVRGECYKTSSKEIYAERCAGGIFSRKETNLFGSLVIVGPKVQETWLMKEGLGSIQAHYDLEQPIFDVKITGQYLEMNSSSAVFPSDFHRYAYLCKMLFHHLLGNAD
ncbi:MAG: hypothetical protein ACXVBE_00825, partial [Bdellovibrionota bacterium]